MILIHPPVAKPCEPPAGVARLFGFLHRNGIECRVLDANLEGLLALIEVPKAGFDRWTMRAVRNRSRNIESLRSGYAFGNLDRYKRTVMDLNRLLEMPSKQYSIRPGLANYQDRSLTPVRSADLIEAAENPERSPFFHYFAGRLPELIRESSARVVGFSLNFLSQALTTFAMLGFVKREFPEILVVLGGGLVTSWMSRPNWRNPFEGLVDRMVSGPGERPLASLFDVESYGEDPATPDYGCLSMNQYLAPGPILPYSASTGCYWSQCSFCPERAEGNSYRPVPVDRVVADLHGLTRDMSPVLIHLLDNAISPSLLEAISEKSPGAPWYGFTRITPHLADPGFCGALKRSGCVMLKLGLESGDQRVLDCERKGLDLGVASRALNALKNAGIATYVYLLFGTPSETLDGARKTLEFTVRHADAIGFLNLAIFNLPIYGPDAVNVKTKALYEGDLSLYTNFIHPAGWHRGLVRQFLDREFRKHPAIASILRNDPPIFTSNHAPFFCRQS